MILETGLGGRLDATNIIKKPIISVITSISKDHTNILGNTLKKIAFEKAGIIKKNVPIICNYSIKKEALDVLKKIAKSKNSEIIISKNNIKILKETYKNTLIETENTIYKLNLPGQHQVLNISTVFSCVDKLKYMGYKISKEKITKALEKVEHPARLEILSESPTIILDGAHNEDGIYNLKSYILKHFGKKDVYAIFSSLKDKYFGTALEKILPIFKKVILVEVNNERSFSILDLCNLVKKYNENIKCSEGFESALKYVKALVKKDDVVFIFGSLYLAEEVKEYLI